MAAADSIHAQDPTTLTPAMRQYQLYKQQYPDAILFFRIGDFYECFYEDARTVSRVLGVALTARSKGENPVPMAGVPFHAVDTYLHRMIAAGFKVAICEQMEDPKSAKGVIKREVTRLVTPGTLTEEAMLDGREENFVAAVVELSENEKPAEARKGGATPSDTGHAAIAWCELSTGKFLTFEGPAGVCADELARLRPREVLFAEAADRTLAGSGAPAWLETVRLQISCVLTARPAWQLDGHHAAQTLKNHYGVSSFAGFGYEQEHVPAIRAAGALVAYLHETQKASLEHLQPPRAFAREGHLTIDPVSLRSLEVLRTIRGNALEGSLVHALDRTHTPMGSRLLRNWLCYPLRDLQQIRRRHDAIDALIGRERLLASLRQALETCSDIERITARVCCRRASPRDLAALARSLDAVSKAGEALGAQRRHPKPAGTVDAALIPSVDTPDSANEPHALGHFEDLLQLLPAAKEIAGIIRACLPDDPPGHLRDGNVIRDGCHADLDRLRTLSRDSRSFLAEYQGKLVERTGITSLKVGYNKVFGFYIEVTNTHAEKIPADFVRKQTVRNAERYITPELKQYEAEILTAQERSLALEQELFESLRQQLAGRVADLQALAHAAATLDVTCGLAHLARQRHYVRPEMSAEKVLHIADGRHPVVEQVMGEKFVPNDTLLGSAQAGAPGAEPSPASGPQQASLHLITGPNMAGKSTYIRQVALLVLMAQAGSFVPAKSATIGLVDRIFTRVGAADDLAGGQSTFMVEMIETANILHHASEQSLVILDEIGRGTSTLDGLALAWAIAEYLAFTCKARTLFATHYHELTELADTAPASSAPRTDAGRPGAVANYNVLVREWEDQIIFMHRIAPGAADKSYGVHVARLAGVPRSVVTRARTLMGQLAVHVGKSGRPRAASTAVTPQVGMFDPVDQQVITQLRALDMNRMSPMQAWEALRMLQGMLGGK